MFPTIQPSKKSIFGLEFNSESRKIVFPCITIVDLSLSRKTDRYIGGLKKINI